MENLYEWWQLFDAKTRRFYYYNVSSQKTVWHIPKSDLLRTKNDFSLVPLASRLINVLIKNLEHLCHANDELTGMYDKLKAQLDNLAENEDTLHMLLEENYAEIQDAFSAHIFTNLNISDRSEIDNLFSSTSYLTTTQSKSAHSIVSIPLKNEKRRMIPRTNPNYINVDFIDFKNGSTVKSTYINVQDINETLPSQVSKSEKLERKRKTNAKEEASFVDKLNNDFSYSRDQFYKYPEIYQATLILLSILKNTENKGNFCSLFFSYFKNNAPINVSRYFN
jgi:hypothetical protein